MGIVQLEQILQRDDVPSDVKEVVIDHLNEIKREKEVSETDQRFLENKQLLEGILKNLPVILFRFDEKGFMTKSVGAGLQRVGFNDHEAIGRNVFEDHPQYEDEIKRVLAGETICYEGQGSNNGQKWVLLNFMFYDSMRGGGAIGFSIDLTERKKMEESLIDSNQALQDNESMLQMSQEIGRVGSFEMDLKTSDVRWSNQLYKLFGLKKSENVLDYEKVLSLIHPDDRERAITVSSDAVKEGKAYDLEHRVIHPDGTILDLMIKGDVIRNEKNEPVKIVGTTQDITEQKRAVKSLRESEERLRAFMNSATNNIYLLDSDLNIVDINKTALNLLNLKKIDAVGRNITEFIPDVNESGRVDKYLEVIKTGKPLLEENIVFHPTSLSHPRHFSVRSFKVGEGLGIISTDITKLKQADKVRQELEERREKFIWMASHELRTPLTVITGYFEFWEKNFTELDQDRQEKISSTIKSNLRRLEHLIDEVSLIAQFEQGLFKIEKSAFDFNTFFQEAKEEYKTLLGEQLKVNVFQVEFPLIIMGDLNRLRQVLDNVVNNAIRQTHSEHRQIKLSLTISPSIIRIICTDNGAGIAPDNLERIFDQFLSIETEFAAAGTGIGLYLSRKIMKALGGSLTAQSQGIGHGATFIVELPNIHPE